MKRCYAVLLLLCSIVVAHAQYSITGKITDKQTGKAIDLATVQLLNADSSFVNGASTSQTGAFKLTPKKEGRYIIKMSFIGYSTAYRSVTLSNSKMTADLGTIGLGANEIMLKGAQVTAKAAQVEMKADTFVYNASAYRVPEGSTIETLIEKLPGVEIGDDGSIKINGKTVSQILMNGKDFFRGDTQLALKNLPTNLVNQIKSYDKKSDYAKQTGIDDGNEETVIDLSLKRELKASWVSNVDLGYGSKDRYTDKIFVNRFTDQSRFTVMGSANNVNDRGFRGGWGRGGGGLTASKMAGINYNWDNGKKEWEAGRFQFDGNFRYNHSSSDSQSRSNSETFLTSNSASSFANSISKNKNSSTNFNGNLRFEWHPDTLTTLTFRPEFSYSESNGWSQSRSVTFNSDPYAIDGIRNPLDSMYADFINPDLQNIAVNRNWRQSINDGRNRNMNASFMVVRRLNSSGRNISFNTSANYSNRDNHSFSHSDITYYQASATRPHTFSNQYSNNPSMNWGYSAQLSYSEPIIAKKLFFQANYNFGYSYSNSDRSLYQLDSLSAWDDYRLHPLGTLPSADLLATVLNARNSQYATYKDYNHNASVGFRWSTEKLQANATVDFRPQTTKMAYQRDKMDTVITRNVFNVAPNIRVRYKFSQTSTLDFRYRGNSSQPSMTNLLDITDDSDPLNISKGNPGLKPSWTNNLSLWYNNYIPDKQMGWSTNTWFSQTSNSISNAMHYDEATGVRTTRPENINGNWNFWINGMFNTALGSAKAFNVSTSTDFNYDNSVGYVSTGQRTESQKNTTKTFRINENLRLNYRNDWFEVGLRGSINYQNSKNKLQSNANLDIYNFSYGFNTNIQAPWNMQISTDLGMSSRRGYSDKSMNTNELIWNAQIAQNFLKGNAATISIQFYDILHEQSNISRTINAQMRRDTWNNSINSYFMVHLIYRLNLFAGSSKCGGNMDRGQRPGGWGGGGQRIGGRW